MRKVSEQMNSLFVLNHTGDVQVTWNHEDPAEVAKARAEIEALKAAGYQFFLVDGTPADAVAAGAGTLNCRRVEAETLLPAPSNEINTDEPRGESPNPARRGPGRPRKDATPEPVTAVAVRPMRGG